MRKSAAFALGAAVLAAIVIRLSPLLTFVSWGADIGEYLAILRALVETGHMPVLYSGWGVTYPSFPGMFFFQDVAVRVGGVDPSTALNLIVPIAASLAILPLFLIASRITGDARAAIVAAAILAVAMPHAYPTSHTAPASLGDLLAVSGLLLYLRVRDDPRASVPFALVTLALVETHHLSTYFFLIMILATTALRSLITPTGWSRGLRWELGCLAFSLVATFAYWFLYAPVFGFQLLQAIPLEPWWLVFVGFASLLFVVAIAVALRARMGWRYRPRYPSSGHARAMFSVALAFVFGFAGALLVVPVPATTISLTPITVVAFAPFLVLLALSASGRNALDFLRDGVAPLAWLVSLVASSTFGIVAAPVVLIPYRHVEFIMVPLAIFAGAGLFRLLDLGGITGRRRTAALTATCALILASAFIAIPPASALGGWQEGVRSPAIETAYWARDHVNGLVAADHVASTVAFGFGGRNATWDRTTVPFLESTGADPLAGLAGIPSPSGASQASYVWVDRDTQAGVRLGPYAPAVPMPADVAAKFDTSPFVKVFDNGYAQVFWIAWGCGTATC